MYNLIISPKAQRELKKISMSHRLSIGRILEEVKEDPFLGKPLIRELTQRFSYRVGVYRIIYVVHKKDKVINVLTAGHRATIYN